MLSNLHKKYKVGNGGKNQNNQVSTHAWYLERAALPWGEYMSSSCNSILCQYRQGSQNIMQYLWYICDKVHWNYYSVKRTKAENLQLPIPIALRFTHRNLQYCLSAHWQHLSIPYGGGETQTDQPPDSTGCPKLSKTILSLPFRCLQTPCLQSFHFLWDCGGDRAI